MEKSYLDRQNLPPGLRNNNPGNLIKTAIPWQGKLPQSAATRFERFVNIKFGLRALFRQIHTDVYKRKMNLTQLLNKYAPTFENNTNVYIQTVSKETGIHPTQPIYLTVDVIKKIVRAIVKVEIGKDVEPIYLEQSDYDEAFAISGLILPE